MNSFYISTSLSESRYGECASLIVARRRIFGYGDEENLRSVPPERLEAEGGI